MHEFPDEPAAQQGRALLDSLHAKQTQARSAAKAQSQSAEVQQALAPIESSYQEMGRKIKAGMQSASSQSTEIDDFNSAIEMGKSARDSLHAMQGGAATTPGLAPASQELDGELVDQLVNAYTQLANAYNQRTSYNDANTAVDQGLALQPKNQGLPAAPGADRVERFGGRERRLRRRLADGALTASPRPAAVDGVAPRPSRRTGSSDLESRNRRGLSARRGTRLRHPHPRRRSRRGPRRRPRRHGSLHRHRRRADRRRRRRHEDRRSRPRRRADPSSPAPRCT
jgi:hypothetical protein